MKYILLLIALLTIDKSFSQTTTKVISDNEIINFIRWQIISEKRYPDEPPNNPKNICNDVIQWRKGQFELAPNTSIHSLEYLLEYLFNDRNKWLDTIFTIDDKMFLASQCKKQKKRWDKIARDVGFIKCRKLHLSNIHHLSIPLFSMDRQFVLIRESYYCGSLCAYSAIKIYKRKKDGEGWEFLKSINGMMS